jgi:hypothetical protein
MTSILRCIKPCMIMNFSKTEIFQSVLYYVCILHKIFPSLYPDKISNMYICNPITAHWLLCNTIMLTWKFTELLVTTKLTKPCKARAVDLSWEAQVSRDLRNSSFGLVWDAAFFSAAATSSSANRMSRVRWWVYRPASWMGSTQASSRESLWWLCHHPGGVMKIDPVVQSTLLTLQVIRNLNTKVPIPGTKVFIQ